LVGQGKKVVEIVKALSITDVIYCHWHQEVSGMSIAHRPSAWNRWSARMVSSARPSPILTLDKLIAQDAAKRTF